MTPIPYQIWQVQVGKQLKDRKSLLTNKKKKDAMTSSLTADVERLEIHEEALVEMHRSLFQVRAIRAAGVRT